MLYTVKMNEAQRLNIIVVGCGGTGSMVSEGLCRLLCDRDNDLLLIDHDRVEPHNLRRQNFYAGDVGRFKSQALAERLSRQYGRKVAYSVLPYSSQMLRDSGFGGFQSPAIQGLILGCVDNARARQEIARSVHWGNYWLDAGNGHHSGQVLFGNAKDPEELSGAFDPDTQTVNALPCPSMQQPALLIPVPEPAKRRDCAQAVVEDDQSPLINQAMAVLVLQFVDRILKGELTYIAAYLDIEVGSLNYVPATPEAVAKLCGLTVDTVINHKCRSQMRMKERVRL